MPTRPDAASSLALREVANLSAVAPAAAKVELHVLASTPAAFARSRRARRRFPRAAGPIRIADIINLSTSANTLLRERVLTMRARGFDNRILCIDGPSVPALREAGIPVTTVHLPRGLDPVALARAFAEIAAYLHRERIHLVHTHCAIPGVVGRLAARAAGVPVVMHTAHGYPFHERSPRLERLLYVSLERVAARASDWLLTQSRFDYEQAKRYGLIRSDRLQWIGNGIDLRRFRPGSREATAGRPVIITCVARMEPVKNHRLLLEAARLLCARGESFRVLLVGDGELRSELEGLCARWSIADVVEFLGYRDDIPALLAETDIAVLSSRKEGIPRSVLEPMAMGIPVVATRVTGTCEAVRDGETGVLVDPEDASGLADALQRLIRDPGLRARMGARARQHALEEFDEARVVDRIEQVYRRLLSERAVGMPTEALQTPEGQS